MSLSGLSASTVIGIDLECVNEYTYQLTICTRLRDPTPLQDDNPLSASDRRQTMCDYETGCLARPQDLVDRIVDLKIVV